MKQYIESLIWIALLAVLCGVSSAQVPEHELEELAVVGEWHQAKSVTDREQKLAELHFENGLHVVFSYDKASAEFGLVQEGRNDSSAPLVTGEVESLLAVFLAITPADVPIPELLLAEPPADFELPAQAHKREISRARVSASGLSLPITAPSKYYASADWIDGPAAAWAPKSYNSSSFGGKFRYADSYVSNRVPSGSPSWLWVRHRIYYKNIFGNYVKHFGDKVQPGYWQAAHKGSIKRYRRVSYDDGWGSSPNCGGTLGISCTYWREGRFHD